MSLFGLALGSSAALSAGYTWYGKALMRDLGPDRDAATPATQQSDGIDFVPTKVGPLLAQHFSAIAAAGPIAGPILAAQQFGWVPAMLWIVLGVIFIGAVHDAVSLYASVKSHAKSIAAMVGDILGPKAGRAMTAFIWCALVYVIVAFTDMTAQTFRLGDPELQGVVFNFHPGKAIATAASLYLLASVALGLLQRFTKLSDTLTQWLALPIVFACVWLGTAFPLPFELTQAQWAAALLIYCVVASVVPVWALLQPRGTLGGYVLYAAIGSGLLGMAVGGRAIELPAFIDSATPVFPFLFVTIACGACSGFHGLVCSGTTSKQLSNEKHVHPVGFGAMLLEGMVAIIALGTVMMQVPSALNGRAPGAIYGIGLGQHIASVLGDGIMPYAVTFGAMAFSTFVFDTLDVSVRLGRYLLQELFAAHTRTGVWLATLATAGVPWVVLYLAEPGAWRTYWTLFGASNQLLAALTLLALSAWLKSAGKKAHKTFWPGLFVLAVTLSALWQCLGAALKAQSTAGLLNALLTVGLGGLGLWLSGQSIRQYLRTKPV